MSDKMNLKELAVAVYQQKVPVQFSQELTLDDMEGALREKLRKLAPDFNTYRRNKLEIFELIQEVVDDVLPKRILDRVGMFAEVKTFAQGNRAQFTVKKGRKGVRRFITRVGLGGVYERVRLDKDHFDMTTHAYGGAAYIEFEAFLDGQMDWVELMNLILQGIEDEILREIYAALLATYDRLPAANKYTGNTFNAQEMNRLLTTVRAYGGNATIFCTPEFAATIMADDKFIGDADKEDYRNQGYVGRFAGSNVVVLPQSFEDETNTEKVMNPEYAFIIPSGGSADEKVVKVGIEGQTVVRDVENADYSMEFQAYKKLGTIILHTNHYGIYRNTEIA